MTVLVGRRESFNAAHQLCDPDLSDDENRRMFGKCANLHGHNYILEVVVAGEMGSAAVPAVAPGAGAACAEEPGMAPDKMAAPLALISQRLV